MVCRPPPISRDLQRSYRGARRRVKEVHRASDNGAEEASSRVRIQPEDKARKKGGEGLRERAGYTRGTADAHIFTYYLNDESDVSIFLLCPISKILTLQLHSLILW
jgi:hypothetical protein